MIQDGLLTYHPLNAGSKGLLFVGDKIVVYRRDSKAPIHPLEIDLPGGGPEAHETPFETFKREVKEEFNLDISLQHITYASRYPSMLKPGTFGWFMAAHLPASAAHDIRFGDEGIEYMLLSVDDYLSRTDAWPVFQERTRDYITKTRPALLPE